MFVYFSILKIRKPHQSGDLINQNTSLIWTLSAVPYTGGLAQKLPPSLLHTTLHTIAIQQVIKVIEVINRNSCFILQSSVVFSNIVRGISVGKVYKLRLWLSDDVIDSPTAVVIDLVLEELHPKDGKEIVDDQQEEKNTGGIGGCGVT